MNLQPQLRSDVSLYEGQLRELPHVSYCMSCSNTSQPFATMSNYNTSPPCSRQWCESDRVRIAENSRLHQEGSLSEPEVTRPQRTLVGQRTRPDHNHWVSRVISHSCCIESELQLCTELLVLSIGGQLSQRTLDCWTIGMMQEEFGRHLFFLAPSTSHPRVAARWPQRHSTLKSKNSFGLAYLYLFWSCLSL